MNAGVCDNDTCASSILDRLSQISLSVRCWLVICGGGGGGGGGTCCCCPVSPRHVRVRRVRPGIPYVGSAMKTLLRARPLISPTVSSNNNIRASSHVGRALSLGCGCGCGCVHVRPNLNLLISSRGRWPRTTKRRNDETTTDDRRRRAK